VLQDLPPPPAGLFISAGAIVAERAVRGGSDGAHVEAILRRAVEQAGRILAEEVE